MGVIQQFGHTQQEKFASQEFADSGLRHIQDFFQLARSNLFLLDQSKDVLMQVSLQF